MIIVLKKAEKIQRIGVQRRAHKEIKPGHEDYPVWYVSEAPFFKKWKQLLKSGFRQLKILGAPPDEKKPFDIVFFKKFWSFSAKKPSKWIPTDFKKRDGTLRPHIKTSR